MSGEYHRIVQAVQQLDAVVTIPFVSLTDRIQRKHRCWLSFRESNKYSKLALCATKMVEFNYSGEQGNRFYIPHHIIVMRPGRLNDTHRRLAVGHEIGHIVLHFQRYQHDLTHNPAGVLGENGQIKNKGEEEVEATVFAALLCRRRSPSGRRRPVPVDDLVREIDDVLANHVDLPRAMKQQTIQGVKEASEELVAGQEQAINRDDEEEPSEALRLAEAHCNSCDYGEAVSNATRYLCASRRFRESQDYRREEVEKDRAIVVLKTAMHIPEDNARNRVQRILNAMEDILPDSA